MHHILAGKGTKSGKTARCKRLHYFPYSNARSKTRVVGYFCVKLDLMYWPISRTRVEGKRNENNKVREIKSDMCTYVAI